MPAINDLIKRVVPLDSSDSQPDLTLGLPLETESKTIYPVFQESKSNTDGDRALHQVGYLEISQGRSDFVSLESRRSATLIIPAVIILLFLAVFQLFRRRRR